MGRLGIERKLCNNNFLITMLQKIFKKFAEWINLKEKLHNTTFKSPQISEGDIWWVSIGENIGKEINGKSKLFSRPVLVFKKLSREIFLGLPTTTQEKKGTWFVEIYQGGKIINIILSQARTFDTKRLSTRIGSIDDSDMRKVKTGFQHLFLPK